MKEHEDLKTIERVNNAILNYDASIFNDEDLLQEIYLYALEHKFRAKYYNSIVSNILIKVKNKYDEDQIKYKSFHSYCDIDKIMVTYDHIFENRELRYYIDEILCYTDARDYKIATMYYGIGQPKQSIKTIAKIMGYNDKCIHDFLIKFIKRFKSINNYMKNPIKEYYE